MSSPARIETPRASRPAKVKPSDALRHYHAKRDFALTPEPDGGAATRSAAASSFVVQEHAARQLHYDFRLELDGVLLSWAVPKGPSTDPAVKRMAVRTEDHPLAYADFEGTIPSGQYGAGTVRLWDRGRWTPLGEPHAGLDAGKLSFELHGDKLRGRWELVRMRGQRKETWLLFKRREADDQTPPPRRGAPSRSEAPRLPAGMAKAPLPPRLSPQLAMLASAPPTHGRWIFENKFDGYRLLARIERGAARLFTRNGNDWTAKLPALADDIGALGWRSAWLDGEIVVAGRSGDGAGDFNALQNAFDLSRTQAIDYFVFDLPYFDGHDLRELPLSERREWLRQLLAEAAPGSRLRFSEALGAAAPDSADAAGTILREACGRGLEGIIAKRHDAPYRSARNSDWLKLKCHLRQEFVIIGYRLRSDDADAVGSLLLAVHGDDGRLQPVGSVGTGWDRRTARELRQRLGRLDAAASPLPDDARRTARRSRPDHWVRPTCVAEVQFGEWTPAGQIRHASFVALRSDKPARQITRERGVSAQTAGEKADGRAKARGTERAPARAAGRPGTARSAAAKKPRTSSAKSDPQSAPAKRRSKPASTPADALQLPAGVRLTHGERVIDAASGCTKLDLMGYYDSVADWMLPHLKGRPVAMLRAPDGVDAGLFFQRHGGQGIAGIRTLDAALWPGHAPLLEIGSRQALLGAVQMNAVEFHTWNVKVRHFDRPDRIIFDLDPGQGVGWPAIREGAELLRALLLELKLHSWLKTSGGNGLHLVVPIAPRWSVDTAKALAQAVVAHLARTVPQRFVAKSGAARRVGRIFVDYLRNGEGATTVAAFSARARPTLGVSMPLTWEELPSLRSASPWTIANAGQRLQPGDAWADAMKQRQSIGAALRTLGVER